MFCVNSMQNVRDEVDTLQNLKDKIDIIGKHDTKLKVDTVEKIHIGKVCTCV